ncbi:MAG: glutamate synthase-related protein [bacterium]|nr:glutamate synthase-related protein [bacterium]
MGTTAPKSYEHHDACGLSAAIKSGAPSHAFLEEALSGCSALDHRGGNLPIDQSGDGIGIATSMPWSWVRKQLEKLGIIETPETQLTCGLFFFSRELSPDQQTLIQNYIRERATQYRLDMLGIQKTPFETSHLGTASKTTVPNPYYLYFKKGDEETSSDAFEKNLYLLQQDIERWIADNTQKKKLPPESLRIISLSPHTLVHKGMGNAEDLKKTWGAMSDPDFEVNWYALHRRFSTNTFPQWWLAQPFFMMLHNGEINTIEKNRRTARLLERQMQKARHYAKLLVGGSDSAETDRVLQQRYFAFKNFYDSATALLVALETIIPPAYYSAFSNVRGEFKEFLNFHRRHLGGGSFFGGPAFVMAFTENTLVGKVDNMALRPAKWREIKWKNPKTNQHERVFTMGSEYGALHGDSLENIVDGGILQPGEIIMSRRRDKVLEILDQEACHNRILDKTPSPVQHNIRRKMHNTLDDLCPRPSSQKKLSPEQIHQTSMIRGWKKEHEENLRHMAVYGKLKVSAMGTPWPMGTLRTPNCSVFEACQQRFAQVTNPPVDPLRESDKCDLTTHLGGRHYNSSEYSHEPIEQIRLKSPIISNHQISQLREQERFKVGTLDCSLDISALNDGKDYTKALESLGKQAIKEARSGAKVIILSHRQSRENGRVPIESPLAVGAVMDALNTTELRQNVSIVIEGDDVKEAHDAGLLIAMGVNAVNPALAEDMISNGASYTPDLVQSSDELIEGIPQAVGSKVSRKNQDEQTLKVDAETGTKNLYKTLEGGLMKIMSKMGINDIDGYRSSGLFEVIGLGPEVHQYLNGFAPSRIGGQDMDDRLNYLREQAKQVEKEKHMSFNDLPNAWTKRGVRGANIKALIIAPLKELLNHPEISEGDLSKGITSDSISLEGLQKIFQAFPELRKLISFGGDKNPFQIRELLDVAGLDLEKINQTELEATDVKMAFEQFLPRLKAGQMSFGALMEWAKEAIETGFNSLGTFGGSGEGGIPKTLADHSKPKSVQVASGRFGVTAEYLANPDVKEICIKIAQGAKPGEGGQLPAYKVSSFIAKNRYCEEGIELISPPPHHDIYSIEELTQLIEDLRSVNPSAKIAVKLVSGTGIGAISCGVVKAGADIIEIDGYEGGTGARSFESHHAGLPTEYGIKDVHQALADHSLRDLVKIRAMGGIKSPMDILKYMLMGSDEISSGTLAMVALNCNLQANCNAGCGIQIAHPLESASKTYQEIKEVLNDRVKYKTFIESRAKQVALLFLSFALELSVMCRQLRINRVEDLIGRTELLTRKKDLSPLTSKLKPENILERTPHEKDLIKQKVLREENRRPWDRLMTFKDRQEWKNPLETDYFKCTLSSASDRSFGAKLSGDRIRKGETDLMRLETSGCAGNSYAVWGSINMKFIHRGTAEEGFAKGISEGCEVSLIRPNTHQQSSLLHVPIVSNNIGFGATGGKIFVDSLTGQRCGIRMSGTTQLFARGGGEYAAEYMTGGTMTLLPHPNKAGTYEVVRGKFGAGMSGGQAFVFVNHGQNIHHHLDNNLEVIELNEQQPAEKEALFTSLQQYQSMGLSETELEYWKENTHSERGRVVCIKARKPELIWTS